MTGAQSAAASAWSLSAPVTLTAAGTVTLSFDYSEGLTLSDAGAAPVTVQAAYSYGFNIQDGAGTLVFSSAPNAVNAAQSLASPGSLTRPGSGSISITSGTLAAGTYRVTLAGANQVFLNDPAGRTGAAVPEPGPLALVVPGLAALGGVARRRRIVA